MKFHVTKRLIYFNRTVSWMTLFKLMPALSEYIDLILHLSFSNNYCTDAQCFQAQIILATWQGPEIM